jgi:UDP-N-acetyl-D-glucosamine dehydrogenase
MGHHLSLAINGREHQLHSELVAFPRPRRAGRTGVSTGYASTSQLRVAIIGRGYVGLPTALGLASRCKQVVGVDISDQRLHVIAAGTADMPDSDRPRLAAALGSGELRLTTDKAAITDADAVIICVPTPVDAERVPELPALYSACADVVANARTGQTVILTSTTHVGTTTARRAAPGAWPRGRYRRLRGVQPGAHRPGQPRPPDRRHPARCRRRDRPVPIEGGVGHRHAHRRGFLYERLARRVSPRTLAMRVRRWSRLHLPVPPPGTVTWADVPRQLTGADEAAPCRASTPDALAGAVTRGGDDR